MNDKTCNTASSLTLGLAMIGLSCLVLFLTKDITRTGLAANGDLGPRLFPVALSLGILFFGLWEMIRWTAQRWKSRKEDVSQQKRPVSRALSTDRGTIDAWLLVIVLGGSIAAISWFGFVLSMLTFSAVMMTYLGLPATYKWMESFSDRFQTRTRWCRALLVALLAATLASSLLIGSIYLLFVICFEVQLPEGSLGLPF